MEYKVKDIKKRVLLKFIDTILQLFIIHPPKCFPPDPERILVVRLDNLGDILLTRPLLKSIRDNYPIAQIDVLLQKPALNILREDKFIDNVFCYSNTKLSDLRQKKYDLLIEPKGRLDYALISWWINPGFSIGYGDAGGGPLFDRALVQLDQHPINKNKQICTYLDVKYSDDFPDICFNRALLDKYAKYHDCILICPFSSRLEKDWSINKYLDLLDYLSEAYHVVFAGLKTDELRFSPVSNVCETLLFGPNELFDFVALIKQSRLLIGSDSAPIHIAGAVGTPSIALYGIEDPGVWHPYSEDHYAIRKSNDVNDITFADIKAYVDSVLL